MFENISGDTNENADLTVYETDALMQKLEDLNTDNEVMRCIEEVLEDPRFGYTTLADMLNAVESLESFTDGEIKTIEAAFDALSLNRNLAGAVEAVEALAGAIEAAKERV
jgi:hypothetical protein